MTIQKRRFSYSSPHDGFFKSLIINAVELLTGRRHLQEIYREIHEEEPTPWNVWSNLLQKLHIKVDFDQKQLDKVPETGPVIFVANHPYGVVDGVILCDLVTRKRKDYFLLVNEVLSHEPVLEGHLLPVDFREGREAMRTNLKTRKETTKNLNEGKVLAIFPSGAVATSMSWFGEVEEFPWRKFISGRIHDTKCTVIPLFFHGTNSRLFQLVSQISMNLRLGLLMYEVMNKRKRTIKVDIGDPISYDVLQHYPNRQELIDFLRTKTLEMKS